MREIVSKLNRALDWVRLRAEKLLIVVISISCAWICIWAGWTLAGKWQENQLATWAQSTTECESIGFYLDWKNDKKSIWRCPEK